MATIAAPDDLSTGPPPAPGRFRAGWTIALVAVAALAVGVAAVWGVRGLLADPVKGTDANGVTTIEGTWEPFDCGSPCVGYLQAGGRSVTVVLPASCPAPQRAAGLRVLGTLDPSQGRATYRATGCPVPT